MKKANGRSVVPACPLTHNLLDKLTVIVGRCELLGATASADSPSSKKLEGNPAGGPIDGGGTLRITDAS
jgi:hypothetical protein